MSFASLPYSSAPYSSIAGESFDLDSRGNIVISGSSEITPFYLESQGNIVIGGISVIVPPQKGGGSYLYPTSWDILQPYFPDDRHILGNRYQGAEAGNGADADMPQTREPLFNFLGDRNKTYPDASVETLTDALPEYDFIKGLGGNDRSPVADTSHRIELPEQARVIPDYTEDFSAVVTIAINPDFRDQILAEERWLEQELLGVTYSAQDMEQELLAD